MQKSKIYVDSCLAFLIYYIIKTLILFLYKFVLSQPPYRRRRGEREGSRGSNEPPLKVNNGGLKTQTVDFQLSANSGGMENKL